MHDDKYLKLYGLSREQGRTLSALFQAASAGRPTPGWVTSVANRPALAALMCAGLVSDQLRLTLPGLAVAASLPKCKHRRWLAAA